MYLLTNSVPDTVDIISECKIFYLIITHFGNFHFLTLIIDAKAKYLFNVKASTPYILEGRKDYLSQYGLEHHKLPSKKYLLSFP